MLACFYCFFMYFCVDKSTKNAHSISATGSAKASLSAAPKAVEAYLTPSKAPYQRYINCYHIHCLSSACRRLCRYILAKKEAIGVAENASVSTYNVRGKPPRRRREVSGRSAAGELWYWEFKFWQLRRSITFHLFASKFAILFFCLSRLSHLSFWAENFWYFCFGTKVQKK